MSDQSQATELPPPPVKQRRKRGPNRPKLAVVAAPKPSPFAGMTKMNCCDGCHKGHCVVSNNTYCAHPYKGGLQNKDMLKHEAVKRFGAAKAFLAHQMVRES
jgi:hypothetical protein